MRNLVVGGMLAAGLLFNTSCLNDDDLGPTSTLEYLVTDSVQVDSVFEIRNKVPMKVHFTLPNSTYSFYNFQDVRQDRTNDSVYEVAVVAAKTEGVNDGTSKPDVKTLEFPPTRTGNYTFRFYAGETPGGVATYINKEFKVVE